MTARPEPSAGGPLSAVLTARPGVCDEWTLTVEDGADAGREPLCHRFAGAEVPSVQARTAALAELGLVPVPGAEWHWTEYPGSAPDVVLVQAVASVAELAPRHSDVPTGGGR